MSFANKPRYNKHSADKQEGLTNFLENIEDDFKTKRLNEEYLIEDTDIEDEDDGEMEEGILDTLIPQLKRGVTKGKNLEQVNKYIEQRSGKRTMDAIVQGIVQTFNVSEKEATAYVALYNLEKGAELVPTHGDPDPSNAQARADVAMDKAGQKGAGVLAAGDEEEEDDEEQLDEIQMGQRGTGTIGNALQSGPLAKVVAAINKMPEKEKQKAINKFMAAVGSENAPSQEKSKLVTKQRMERLAAGDDEEDMEDEGEEEMTEVKEIIKKFQKQYGPEKGKEIYYATANKQDRNPETFKKEEDEEEMDEAEDFSLIFATRERIIPLINIINDIINSDDAPSAINSTPVKRDLASLFLSTISDKLSVDFGKVGNLQQIIADIADGTLSSASLSEKPDEQEPSKKSKEEPEKGSPESQEDKDMKKQKEVDSEKDNDEEEK